MEEEDTEESKVCRRKGQRVRGWDTARGGVNRIWGRLEAELEGAEGRLPE